MADGMTDDLVAFLKACVDERAAVAADIHTKDCAAHTEHSWGYEFHPEWCDCGEPARVLAEVAAKRRIIDALEIAEHNTAHVRRTAPEYRWVQVAEAARDALLHAVRLLASVYAGRPGWRSEWAPDDEEASRG